MTEKPLRFCMVTTFYPPYNFGGDGIFVQRLSQELARRGHHVEVIHCRDAYRLMTGGKPTRDYDHVPNLTVHGLESSFGFLSPLATQQTGRPFFKAAAIRRILDKGFDVIHFHNMSLLGPEVLKFGRGIKLYTMHEYWLVCPTHVLFRFNRAPCARKYCFACTLVHKRPPQWWRYSGLLKTAARHVDMFIAPSRFLRDKHREMGFSAPIIRLPHFVPAIPDDHPESHSFTKGNPEKPYFLFVGRLEALKGVQTLIPIFQNYPKALLFVAGSGEYERHLKALAGDHENIRFLGHCSEQQLQPLYHRAVAVIVPSLWFENLPLVLIEALRQRTPVIVRDLGALPEVVEDSGGGLVYRTDNELVAAMDDLLENPGKRQSLGQLGYQAYQRDWTSEAHEQRYFALIRECAANRARATSMAASAKGME
jgi:glycosyltransferase involved in cell wall biosynthesis